VCVLSVSQELDRFKAMPDYSLYVVMVFFQATNEPANVRQIAGLLLKDYIKLQVPSCPPFTFPCSRDLSSCTLSVLNAVLRQAGMLHGNAELLNIIRSQVVEGLCMILDGPVRRAMGSVVTQLVSSLGVWDELLVGLNRGLEHADLNVIDLNLDCLVKVAEDAPEKMNQAPPGANTALDVIVPRVIGFMRHQEASLRNKAVSFMNNLLELWPQSLQLNLQSFLEALFSLGGDPSNDVRKGCFQGVVQITEEHHEVLAQHMANVMDFMLKGSQDLDEEVAKEATEFWTTLADLCSEPAEPIHATFKEFLPQVVPILLKNMAYSEQEDIDEGEDETIPAVLTPFNGNLMVI